MEVIKNETTINEDLYLEFNQGIANLNKLYLFLTFVLGFLTAFNIYSWIRNGVSFSVVFGAVFMAIMCILSALEPIWVSSIIKRNYRKNKVLQSSLNQAFEFDEFGFNFKASSAVMTDAGRYEYIGVIKVIETNNLFLLMIAKNQAYVVNKGGFENDGERIGELRSILQGNVKNYIFKTKNK